MHEEQDDNLGREGEAEAVGRMLADAFVARVKRFPEARREQLLFACRQRLLLDDEIAAALFGSEQKP